jgi:hypothetical protein
LKTIISSIVAKKNYLLELAEKYNAGRVDYDNKGVTIRDMFTRALPVSITTKKMKSTISLIMFQVWVVLKIVISEASIS